MRASSLESSSLLSQCSVTRTSMTLRYVLIIPLMPFMDTNSFLSPNAFNLNQRIMLYRNDIYLPMEVNSRFYAFV